MPVDGFPIPLTGQFGSKRGMPLPSEMLRKKLNKKGVSMAGQ